MLVLVRVRVWMWVLLVVLLVLALVPIHGRLLVPLPPGTTMQMLRQLLSKCLLMLLVMHGKWPATVRFSWK
jgi:hypothetical protein